MHWKLYQLALLLLCEYLAVDAQCGGSHKADNGSIHSPGHPVKSPADISCTWDIEVAKGRAIKITFPHDILLDVNNYCSKTSLQIIDLHRSAPHQYRKYCSYIKAGETVVTSARRLSINFVTDGAISQNGWQLVWSSFVTDCGETFTHLNGTLSAPNYPFHYPQEMDCTWTIAVPEGFIIKVLFPEASDIAHNAGCYKVGLRFKDNSVNPPKEYKEMCGVYDAGYEIVTASRKLTVYFYSDHSSTRLGWSFQWTAYKPFCDEIYTTDEGVLSSPNFPGNYPQWILCKWTLKVDEGKAIEIMFPTEGNIRQSSGCNTDYLKISDDTIPHEYRKYCGIIGTNTTIVTSSNRLTITFGTSKYETYHGWTLKWKAFPTYDGTVYSGKEGIVSAPNFPNTYPELLLASSTIEVDIGRAIEIYFPKEVEIKHSSGCYKESLKFTSIGINPPKQYADYCGFIAAGTKFVTDSHRLKIEFKTDRYVGRAGWSFNWKVADCGSSPDPKTSATCQSIQCDSVTESDCKTCPIIRQTCCKRCESFSKGCKNQAECMKDCTKSSIMC